MVGAEDDEQLTCSSLIYGLALLHHRSLGHMHRSTHHPFGPDHHRLDDCMSLSTVRVDDISIINRR